jgi:hypothetical protein
MWCPKDLVFEFTDREDAIAIRLLNLHTANGTEPATNRTWLDIASAMNAEPSDGREYNHRSINTRYFLHLAPRSSQESREKSPTRCRTCRRFRESPFPEAFRRFSRALGMQLSGSGERLPPPALRRARGGGQIPPGDYGTQSLTPRRSPRYVEVEFGEKDREREPPRDKKLPRSRSISRR